MCVHTQCQTTREEGNSFTEKEKENLKNQGTERPAPLSLFTPWTHAAQMASTSHHVAQISLSGSHSHLLICLLCPKKAHLEILLNMKPLQKDGFCPQPHFPFPADAAFCLSHFVCV